MVTSGIGNLRFRSENFDLKVSIGVANASLYESSKVLLKKVFNDKGNNVDDTLFS